MKFRLFYNKKPKLSVSDIDTFSGNEYVCHFLLQTMSGKPVTISQSADPDLGIWRVQHGFSCIYFGTYAEAMELQSADGMSRNRRGRAGACPGI